MVSKVLGIVGEGNAMRHFMSNRGSASLQSRKREFFSSLDGVVFFNHSFKKNADYMQHKWSSQYSFFNDVGLKYRAEDEFGAKDNFAEFVASCDIIVDGTKGPPPASLQLLAEKLKTSGYASTLFTLGSDDCTKDYDFYLQRNPAERELRIFANFTDFKQEWNKSYDILRTAAEVNRSTAGTSRQFEIGWRVLTELPFTASIFARRGKEIQDTIKQGIQIPNYLNLANEPCITAGILTSNCPEIAPYTVAIGGFDVSRLKRVFAENKLYGAIMKKCDVNMDDLTISLRGFHDQDVMVPHIGNRVKHSGKLETLLSNGLQYATMYDFLMKEVGQYYTNFNDVAGKIEKRDVNIEIDNLIIDLATNALLSRGKALSVFPSINQDPLCNGYFQKTGVGNEGLFLMGSHRFRNGKVVSDE